jgi:hypothetical protein
MIINARLVVENKGFTVDAPFSTLAFPYIGHPAIFKTYTIL